MLTGNPDAAADLVQDALERTLNAWHRVRNREDPEGYVRRTMVNRNVSIWRRRRREYLVDAVPDDSRYDDPQLPDQELNAALAALPPKQRAVLVLRFAQDMSERQVADMLGCSIGTVKSQTFKALAKVRARLPAPVLGRDRHDDTAPEPILEPAPREKVAGDEEDVPWTR
jgi:RNA polymerase sigma-70 factor (sigma-E family)